MPSINDLRAGVGVLVALAVVLLLTHYGTKWYARRMGGGALGGKYVTVHERVPMGGHSWLVIAEVSGRFYLIGLAEKGVSLLSELQDFQPQQPSASPHSKVPFGKLFTELLNKTGKGSQEGDDGS